jgi:hypothetical protein
LITNKKGDLRRNLNVYNTHNKTKKEVRDGSSLEKVTSKDRLAMTEKFGTQMSSRKEL